MISNARITAQLRATLQLTQTEVQIARIRVAQARTDAVRRELTQNAENAERRTDEIAVELQRLGGVADVVSPVVGRLSAFVKGTVEQAGPIDEALLGDLTLEHQLRDRAVYLGALAEAANEPRVRELSGRLVRAHTATIDWLSTVLAEHALDGPPALKATPLQMVAGGVTRAAALPVRFARDQVSRLAQRAQDRGEQLYSAVAGTADKAARLSDNARDVAVSGRDAALDRAEQVSRRDGASDTAAALHDARTRLGALQESELPIASYDRLGVNEAVSAIKGIDRVADLNTILTYEEANKGRQGVVSAAQTRHAALAKDVAGIDRQ